MYDLIYKCSPEARDRIGTRTGTKREDVPSGGLIGSSLSVTYMRLDYMRDEVQLSWKADLPLSRGVFAKHVLGLGVLWRNCWL